MLKWIITVKSMNALQSCFSLGGNSGKFWWSGQKEGNGSHWVSRDALSNPKKWKAWDSMPYMHSKLALLANQGRRIMFGSLSLLQRVLKARYFPVFIFFFFGSKAKVEFWLSMERQGCYDTVLVSRVGNRENVQICGQTWLSSTNRRYVFSPKPGNSFKMACDLIHPTICRHGMQAK